ncbi:MAG: hypothetical protein K2Q18_00645 [Bdellovibrionales bacterium]|nr:hypothetical protein [Bdellovibrionales bacterium]
MLRISFLVLLLTGLVNHGVMAKTAPNLLLQCLAKEEDSLHKRETQNALFRLNQEFVNELAGSNDITIKKNYVDQICQSKSFSPSVGLLRMLLLKEHELYDLSLSGVEASMRPFKMGYINEFQKQVPRIFIQYISGLQSELATADCLDKAVPELAGLSEKIKYLEEEISTHQLITQKSKIESIFEKLRAFPEIKEKCAQKKRKLDLHLKKKQDSQK